jgi:superfamily II DNA or RNA helicase
MLSLIVDSRLRLPLGQLSPELLEKIKKEFEFKNPQYYINRNRKFSNWKTPEFIKGYKKTKKELYIPRGATSNVISLLEDEGIEYQVINNTRMLPKVNFEFHGELRETQIEPVEAILSRKFTTLSSPVASGKTCMALYTVAIRQQPVCVMVHTRALADQWCERAEQFLGLDKKDIGRIGDGKKNITNFTVAMMQTLAKCSKEVAPYFGYFIADEVHRCPCSTAIKATSGFDSAFATGLSATHNRRDGMTPLIYWTIGPLTGEVGLGSLVREGSVMMVEPIIRETKFRSKLLEASWVDLVTELSQDQKRNELIINDVYKESRQSVCVILSDRKAHCELLTSMLIEMNVKVEMVTGDVGGIEREEILNRLKNGEVEVLVATGQLLGEGFDEKSLNSLFLVTPVKHYSRLVQYLGRVSRVTEEKIKNGIKSKIFDYTDIHCDFLMRAAEERQRTYRKLKKESLKN